MTKEYALPLPKITSLSKVFWDGCKEKKLLYQQCKDCGEVMNLPKYICTNCMSRNIEWKRSKGTGKIALFTVTYEMAPPAFMGVTPYCVAVIEMDEGFRIMSNIIDCDFETLEGNMPVEVVFEDITDEVTLHKFKLV